MSAGADQQQRAMDCPQDVQPVEGQVRDYQLLFSLSFIHKNRQTKSLTKDGYFQM